MKLASPIAVVVAIAATMYGCSLFTELDGFDCGADGCQDAGTDAASAPDVQPATDAGAEDADAEAGRCPEGRGPKMIVADTFCIDSTETTNRQYSEFLDEALEFDAGPLHPVCANVTSHLPRCDYEPVSKPDRPVRCVSWCDAVVYCRWAGKRVCGRIGGGSLTPGQSVDPTVSQWMAACTRLGQKAYAYGATLDPNACPGDGVEPHDVGAFATCEGGYPGIFDMNGNVEEWEDSCRDVDGGRVCEKRGNDYGGSSGACAQSFPEDVFEANPDTGIRCCAD